MGFGGFGAGFKFWETPIGRLMLVERVTFSQKRDQLIFFNNSLTYLVNRLINFSCLTLVFTKNASTEILVIFGRHYCL